MNINQFGKRRKPSGQAGRMKEEIVNKIVRIMGIRTLSHASSGILFLACRDGWNNTRIHSFSQRSNIIICLLIPASQFISFSPNSLIGINWWMESMSVLLTNKNKWPMCTAYMCMKITVLLKCTGMPDIDCILYINYIILHYIILYPVRFGKA